MTELGELVLVLAGLHAALGVHWFPRSAYVFRAFVGTQARPFPASFAWGSDRMALMFGPPLPGTGRFHLVGLFPLSLGRDAVYAHVAQDPNPGGRTPKSGRLVTWDEARTARAEGRDVLVGRAQLVSVGADALARHIARELQRLAVLEPDRRARAIDELRTRSLDESLVRARSDSWTRAARTLRWPAVATALLLFVALPAVWSTVGVTLAWPWLLAAVAATQTWSATTFHRAHRALNSRERGERTARTLAVALSPLEALRSAEILGRDLFAEFHPFAVGAALLTRREFEPFAERVLRDALCPLPPVCPSADPRAIAAEREDRERLVRALEKAAKRLELPRDLASGAPAGDSDERAYCPRCRRTYTLESGTCSECWELPLAPLRPTAVEV
jgi:hypothetical protein